MPVSEVREAFKQAVLAVPSALDWYAEANAELMLLADALGLPVDTVVGMAAALSPSLSWTQTTSAVSGIVLDGDAQGWSVNRAKARAILAGSMPETILSGPKVTAFYAALRTPFEPHEAVIDRHAVSVWLGFESTSYWRKWAYRHTPEIQEAYREVAGEFGFWPHEVQAATWVWWRKLEA